MGQLAYSVCILIGQAAGTLAALSVRITLTQERFRLGIAKGTFKMPEAIYNALLDIELNSDCICSAAGNWVDLAAY